MVAAYPHHINRDGDPHLHVHIAVGNLVQRSDAEDLKNRELYGRALYQQRLLIAGYADREMESRLIARGYHMQDREDGNGAEVAGVSQDAMDLFSSRSRHIGPQLAKLIDEYVRTHDEQPSKRTIWVLGQQAAQNTRRTKKQAQQRTGGKDTGAEVTPADQLAAWEAQAAEQENLALMRLPPAPHPVRRLTEGHRNARLGETQHAGTRLACERPFLDLHQARDDFGAEFGVKHLVLRSAPLAKL